MRDYVSMLREQARRLDPDDVRRVRVEELLAPTDAAIDDVESRLRAAQRVLASGADALTAQTIVTIA